MRVHRLPFFRIFAVLFGKRNAPTTQFLVIDEKFEHIVQTFVAKLLEHVTRSTGPDRVWKSRPDRFHKLMVAFEYNFAKVFKNRWV